MTRLPALLLTLAGLSLPTLAIAQTATDRRSTEAQEQTGIGGAAAQDADATTRAHAGWWAEAGKTRDQRLAWWRDARFGAFIHWGPYSVLGGEWHGQPNPGYSEHIMRVARIPRTVYRDQVAAKFHPDAFDAKGWVRLMKQAGMRYIIITAKHHDGFALWPSEASSYNIRDVSHFPRDPLGELVTAARAEGLKIGFYYSHAFDWEDPDAPGNDWDYDNPGGDRKLHGGADWWNAYPEFLARTQHYVDTKAIPQLKELIARYHPDILWFDTPGKLPFFQQAEIVEAVRRADPDVVINGRAARSAAANLGDYQNTADRPAEVRPTPGDWEAIPTTNESYGFNALDRSHKSPAHFIQLLAKTAAKGGNILLNLGPKGDGTLDAPDVAILEGIATWMKTNGESIRGTTRTPLDRQPWGDSTRKGDRLYLHIFRWPHDGGLIVSGLQSDVATAYLLGDPARKAFPIERVSRDEVRLRLPAAAPNAIDSVIVLESKGALRAVADRVIDLAFGRNQLLAFDAQAIGKGFTYGDGKTGRYYVDGLETPGNRLTWPVRLRGTAPGNITLRYATTAPTGGRFVLSAGGKSFFAQIRPTASPTTMASADFGPVPIGRATAPLSLTIEGAAPGSVHIFELLADR
ncbi:alpha-L-fucosidase [Sphingomonas sp.]|uniref:alpha-L-fucosidase n=1 Tax=Sphingomonas sp. TaxID=28214 RepID=UPI000DB7B0E1|nr:alpha-L-fucosidase [Sphingomonas sp.]PZU08251.1 MAG: alpha-L-fucosidase [Sphingomonas sp.]